MDPVAQLLDELDKRPDLSVLAALVLVLLRFAYSEWRDAKARQRSRHKEARHQQ